MSETLRFFRLDERAILPTKSYGSAAGMDLYNLEKATILPFETKKLPLGICVLLPPNTYGRMLPRSGLSLQGLFINGGVIDPDYTGSVNAIAYNGSEKKITILAGERVAQLVVQPYLDLTPIWTDNIQHDTARGEKGFGSTGK